VKTAEPDGFVADLDLACIGGFVAAALGICAIFSRGSVRCGSHGWVRLMFHGSQLDRVDAGEVTLRMRYGGEGEPVVLLHGHPRTHTTWHRVAPLLSGSFFVVCPDLRGYGQSKLPPDAPGHAQSSKRVMASDVVALMRYLGHDRFSVVGHDRGALVAFRTAMDHPDAVQRFVVMDGLPVIEHLERRTSSPRRSCASSGQTRPVTGRTRDLVSRCSDTGP
jgi:pimeloyl-ACP methyl ester carboxylesterase